MSRLTQICFFSRKRRPTSRTRSKLSGAPCPPSKKKGKPRRWCSIECKRRAGRKARALAWSQSRGELYRALRALGGYPSECRAARGDAAFDALKADLMNRRQLG